MSGLLVARRGSLSRHRPAAALDYAAEVAVDSPVAWWRFEETSGSTVADEVGSNDGTVFGANLNVASFADTGSAASFDGTDDYIIVSDTSTVEMTSAGGFTVEVLAKIDSPSASKLQVIADKTGLSSGNGQWWLGWDNRRGEKSFRFVVPTSSGTNTLLAGGATIETAVTDGGHFAFVKHSNKTELYVNGAFHSDNTGLTFSIATNSINLGIGNRAAQVNFSLGGDLDELAMYDKVLSPARILAHAQAAGVA